jgi:exodeoxyribonuclease VII small subunit
MSAAASTAPGAAPRSDTGTAGSAAAAPPAFEETLARLEKLVTRLESGDLPLDEALRTFEEGVRLTRECQTALGAAQQKVQLLLQRGETVVLEEFDTATMERVSITTPSEAASTGASSTGASSTGASSAGGGTGFDP